jgi:NADPH:quinone reductase-like Zn-dependent oxidoreductase
MHGELRALGIDHLFDYRTEDFEALARQIAGGRGVELILDTIGGDSPPRTSFNSGPQEHRKSAAAAVAAPRPSAGGNR